MVLAESSQSYSERDFQMKACISAAGPTPIGKLDISACSNGTSSKRSKASKMSVSETRFVRGGLRATNNELANGETSAELIKKLIKEADEATSPIQYTFMPISSILQTRFKPGSMNYIRATNLEYYYNGFFNYGCHYVVDVWCNCRGKTCVRHKSENKSPLVPRKLHLWTRQNGTGKDAIGKSWGHGVAATTKISMKRTLCSPYLAPQKMLVNVKHLVTDPTTRQLILLQVKQQE